jgi:hypothetical protein
MSGLSQRSSDHPPAPVFILGAGQAGGARLAALLDAHPRLSCAPSSTLLADLLVSVERNHDALVHYGLPHQYWLRSVARYFEELQRQHAARQGKARWVHCPQGLRIDLLDRAFPTAQIVHLVGRGRRGWRPAPGHRLAPGRYLEIGWEQSVVPPEAGLRRVLDFLGETWDDRVVSALSAADHVIDLTVGTHPTEVRRP